MRPLQGELTVYPKLSETYMMMVESKKEESATPRDLDFTPRAPSHHGTCM